VVPTSLLFSSGARLICDRQTETRVLQTVHSLHVNRARGLPISLGLEHIRNVRLSRSKVSTKSLRLPLEPACSCGTAFPAMAPHRTLQGSTTDGEAAEKALRTSRTRAAVAAASYANLSRHRVGSASFKYIHPSFVISSWTCHGRAHSMYVICPIY
jgi:hypothetical protein